MLVIPILPFILFIDSFTVSCTGYSNLISFLFLLAGRIVWSAAPSFFPEPGLWGGMHLTTMAGILLVVIG